LPTPTITGRPRKTIAGYNSDWIACGGNLPVIYEISNTKFPVNTESIAITEVGDEDGEAEFSTDPVPHGLMVGDVITLSGFDDEPTYNGTKTVTVVGSVTSFETGTNYSGNDTGSFILDLVYNNYATEIEVWAGIAPGHPHASEDPIELIGTIRQIPDANNKTRVDISQYIKTKLSSRYDPNQVSWPNDLNAWTDFYIKYRETYTGSSDSFVDDSSQFIGHAVNNTLQFGNPFGNNLYGYVLDTDAYAPDDCLWLTNFDSIVKFEDIDNEASLISNIGSFTTSISPGGSTTFFSGDGYGVYRIPITSDANAEYTISVGNMEPLKVKRYT
jgi:hypothetical protein